VFFWTIIAAVATGLSFEVQRDVTVEVAYRQPADAFEILDNVSDWWPGYTEPEYRKFWVDSVGVSGADSAYFAQYRVVRERYFDRSGQQSEDPRASKSGLFTDSRALSADPLAHAFYSSETMEEAFVRLRAVVTEVDLEFLRSFIAHFAPRLEPLTSETRRRVAATLDRTREALSATAVAAYVDSVATFFGTTEDVTFTALYVWWPDADRVRASPNGRFLILRVNPHPNEAMSNADVVVHEAVHVLSALQPDIQKRSVTDAILEQCDQSLEHTRRLGVVEEPLATIFGNIEFRRRFEPNRFSWGRQWYGEPWVDVSAKLMYPVVMQAVAGGASLGSPAVARELAAQCRSLLSVVGSAGRLP
jgi:hypothetical protein